CGITSPPSSEIMAPKLHRSARDRCRGRSHQLRLGRLQDPRRWLLEEIVKRALTVAQKKALPRGIRQQIGRHNARFYKRPSSWRPAWPATALTATTARAKPSGRTTQALLQP